jgi:hypothetical protein
MHPIYEYMVGDTVSNVLYNSTQRLQAGSRHKFIIKECMQVYIGSKSVNQFDVWESRYKGLVEHYVFSEDELCMCRMVLVEKYNMIISA